MDLGNLDWIRPQNRKGVRTLKGEQNASIGRPAGRPTFVLGRPARSIGTNRELAHVSRSVGRSTVPLPRSTRRSTGPCLCTSCTPVDRALSYPAASAVLAPFDLQSFLYLLSSYKLYL